MWAAVHMFKVTSDAIGLKTRACSSIKQRMHRSSPFSSKVDEH